MVVEFTETLRLSSDLCTKALVNRQVSHDQVTRFLPACGVYLKGEFIDTDIHLHWYRGQAMGSRRSRHIGQMFHSICTKRHWKGGRPPCR